MWGYEEPQTSHFRNLDTVIKNPESQSLAHRHGLSVRGIIKARPFVSGWGFLLVTVVADVLKYTQIGYDQVTPRLDYNQIWTTANTTELCNHISSHTLLYKCVFLYNLSKCFNYIQLSKSYMPGRWAVFLFWLAELLDTSLQLYPS